MDPFQFLEHPTDLYMRTWGTDQEALFNAAARGMMSKMARLHRSANAPEIQTKTLDLSSPSLDELFVDWLSEILYQFSVHDFYFANARFHTLSTTRLSATIEGWPVSKLKLRKGLEIKAVTYHGLRVTPGPRWEAEVILDV